MTTYTWWMRTSTKEIGLSVQSKSPDEARRDLLKLISSASIADIEAIREQISMVLPTITSSVKEIDVSKPVKFSNGKTWIALALIALIAVGLVCVTLSGSKTGINVFPQHSNGLLWDTWVTGVAGVFAVFCILFGIRFSDVSDTARFERAGRIRTWKIILLGLWVMLPPIWFSCEYFFLYPQPMDIMTMHNKAEAEESKIPGVHASSQPITGPQQHAAMTEAEILKEHFEKFNRGQENASKIWLAVVTLLTALYFGKEIGTKRD